MLDVVARDLESVAELWRRVGALRLDIFGSAVRSDFDPKTSACDFLLDLGDLPPARYAEAFFLLKDNLETLFGRSIDLITEASLENPTFRARVNAERHTIYAR